MQELSYNNFEDWEMFFGRLEVGMQNVAKFHKKMLNIKTVMMRMYELKEKIG